MSQHALMGPTGGLGTASGGGVETQPQASQLQLQLQSQAMEAHYGREAQRNQSQSSQNSVSQLDMLERSLSRTNSREGSGSTERIVGGDGGTSEHHRPQQQQQQLQQQQHRLPSHPSITFRIFIAAVLTPCDTFVIFTASAITIEIPTARILAVR